MISSFSRGLLAVTLLLAYSAAASGQSLQWIWWKMEPTLSLTPEQSTQIEGIFQSGIAVLKKEKGELDRLEDTLSSLIETMASEPEVTQHIDRVEAARSSLNKTRTLMLLHMRQVLTPEQRLKLNALRDSREQARKTEERERDRSRLSPGAGKSPDGARKRQN